MTSLCDEVRDYGQEATAGICGSGMYRMSPGYFLVLDESSRNEPWELVVEGPGWAAFLGTKIVRFNTVTTTSPEVKMDGCDWRREVFSRLREVANLPSNWDGEGSPAPDPAIVAAAMALLDRVGTEDLPVPLVCPICGGGFQFEWTLGNKHLELEMPDAATVVYLKADTNPAAESVDSGEYPLGELEKTRRLLGWLCS